MQTTSAEEEGEDLWVDVPVVTHDCLQLTGACSSTGAHLLRIFRPVHGRTNVLVVVLRTVYSVVVAVVGVIVVGVGVCRKSH